MVISLVNCNNKCSCWFLFHKRIFGGLPHFSCCHVNFVFEMIFMIVLTLSNLAVCFLSLSYTHTYSEQTICIAHLYSLYLFDQVFFLFCISFDAYLNCTNTYSVPYLHCQIQRLCHALAIQNKQ